MRAPESITNTFASATSTAGVVLLGGYYQLAAHSAAWNAGNTTVDQLMPDGVTWLKSTVLVLSADGVVKGYLPGGEYRLTLTTTAAANVSLVRIPGE